MFSVSPKGQVRLRAKKCAIIARVLRGSWQRFFFRRLGEKID
jgi:hypothetical protein